MKIFSYYGVRETSNKTFSKNLSENFMIIYILALLFLRTSSTLRKKYL